jgi:Protein of unknown function (DUF1360)
MRDARPERPDRTIVERLRTWKTRYSAGEERPLGSYGLLLVGYLGTASGLVVFGRRRQVVLPERIAAADLVLLAVAVFRASRLITKDSVTAVVRAPFTRFEAPAGEGEVHEEVIGRGPTHAVGELLTCPFCLSVWLSTIGLSGLVIFPRQTRALCSAFTVAAGADALQFAYSLLDKTA